MQNCQYKKNKLKLKDNDINTVTELELDDNYNIKPSRIFQKLKTGDFAETQRRPERV